MHTFRAREGTSGSLEERRRVVEANPLKNADSYCSTPWYPALVRHRTFETEWRVETKTRGTPGAVTVLPNEYVRTKL